MNEQLVVEVRHSPKCLHRIESRRDDSGLIPNVANYPAIFRTGALSLQGAFSALSPR